MIPEDIKHGTELYCSYFACRNAGIKFRYCVYCKLPVAKRNFAKRHRHTGKISASDLPRDFEEGSEGDELSSSEQGSAGLKSPSPEKAVTAPSVAAAKPQNAVQWEAQELLDLLLARNVQELQSDGSTSNGSNKSPIAAEMLEQLIQKNQGEWDRLLMDRPRTSNDPSAMASWLLEVLRVSDVEKTTAVASAAAVATALPISLPAPKTAPKTKKPGLKKKKRNLVQKVTTSAKKVKPKKAKKQEVAKPTVPPKEKTMNPNPEVSAIESTAPIVELKEEEKPVQDKKPNEDEDTDVEDEDIDLKREENHFAAADDSSTSSEDSVDLRASKKART